MATNTNALATGSAFNALDNAALDPGLSTLDYFSPTVQPMTADPGPTSTGSSLFSDIGTGLSDILGGSVGNLALYGGLYDLIANQASSAQKENSALAGQISAIGQPSVAAGQQELGAYQSGQLSTPFQTQLTAALTGNQNQATSQEQQVARALAGSGGGQNISGALVSQTQQIQGRQSQLDTQAISNAFAGELAASNSLINTGGQYVQSGVMQEINSNTQLQAQLADLMGSLANAYAKSTAASGSGSSSNPLGAIGNDIGKLLGGSSAGVSPGSLGIPTNSSGGLTGADTDLGTLGPQLPSLPDYTAGGDITGADLAGGAVTLPAADAITQSGMAGIGDIGSGAADAAAAAGDYTLPEAVVSASSLYPGAVAGGELTGLTATSGDVAGSYASSGIPEAVGGSGSSVLGTAIPIAGAALGAYGTYEGIEHGNTLQAGLSGAGTGASIGSFAGPVGTVVGGVVGALVGIGGALIKGQHTQEGIAQVGANQDVIKLQSGNSALQQGGVAFGAGTDRSKGSSQWFLVPQSSGTIQKTTGSNAGGLGGAQAGQPNVTQGTPFYIGSQASQILTNFANSVPITNGQPDFSSYIAQYNANPDANTGLTGVYENNGGQDAWGQSFPDWLQSIWAVKHNVTGDLTT
jgi:hypothetical protein